jgi:hypothetical protein
MGIRQEDKLAVLERVGDCGGPLGEDPQLGEERLSRVHVLVVAAAPGERPAAAALLEAGGVDALELREHVAEALGEVVANSSDDADWTVEGGGGREVGAGSAKDLLAMTPGCVDGIDADGAGDDQGHDKW